MSQETVKEALLKTIEAIKGDQSAGQITFRADTALVSGLRCEARVRDFPKITFDEPKALGGSDAAPNPLELLLASLGACQEIMYGAYASVMGIELTRVRVDVRGSIDLRGALGMDQRTPSGFMTVEYETTIESPASGEDLARLVQTVETHCPVLDSLLRPVEVLGKVWVNGGALEPAAI